MNRQNAGGAAVTLRTLVVLRCCQRPPLAAPSGECYYYGFRLSLRICNNNYWRSVQIVKLTEVWAYTRTSTVFAIQFKYYARTYLWIESGHHIVGVIRFQSKKKLATFSYQ